MHPNPYMCNFVDPCKEYLLQTNMHHMLFRFILKFKLDTVQKIYYILGRCYEKQKKLNNEFHPSR